MNFAGSILDVLPTEELIMCFRRHKTEISYNIQEQHIFLSQLKDHNLVSDVLYEKVFKMRNKESIQRGVYRILQELEGHGRDSVREFWNCVFQEHILRKYHLFHSLQNKLLGRHYMVCSKQPETKNPTASEEKKAEQEERGTKRKKIDERVEEVESGPSSVSSSVYIRPTLGCELVSELVDSSEEEDGSQFEVDFLPVSCGSVTGVLEKAKFTGPSTKSIRIEERWFTPEEFVKLGRPPSDRYWEIDIQCHGKSLKYLVEKQFLDVHPQGCHCSLCHPKKKHQMKDVCKICIREENLEHCTECRLAFHHHCHLPALHDKRPVPNWKCTFCLVNNYLDFWKNMNLEVALKSPVSGTLRCEYLLLHLYKDTRIRLPPHYITKLNQVKNKLQNNEYKEVNEFIQDVKQIYKPTNMDCTSFQMEDNVFENFKQNFHRVFKIQSSFSSMTI